jgi:hypothetical protein
MCFWSVFVQEHADILYPFEVNCLEMGFTCPLKNMNID